MNETASTIAMMVCLCLGVAILVWGVMRLAEAPTIDVQRAAALGAAEAAWGGWR